MGKKKEDEGVSGVSCVVGDNGVSVVRRVGEGVGWGIVSGLESVGEGEGVG